LIKNHYVPKLILRHFANEERIQYCDLDKKKVEVRNISSTFAEKGYNPDEIELELCHKTKKHFANLLNSKVLKERYRITFSKVELFIVKKYLIITSIRFNITEAMKNFNSPSQMVESYSNSFYSNINKVLACETAEELFECININPVTALENASDSNAYGETNLWLDI